MCKKKKIYIICLIFYLIIVFVTEIFYRNKLYELSVEFEEKINQKGFLHYFYFFWSYIFIYGMLLVGTIIVMFLYPINILFCYLAIIITLTFTMCLLKSIYINSRPYWDIFNENYKNITNNNIDKFPTECDGGFGNPSGHSLMSTSFLCLWYLFINSNPIKKFKKNL
jgi:membrane-associated phospholipid phosphatase